MPTRWSAESLDRGTAYLWCLPWLLPVPESPLSPDPLPLELGDAAGTTAGVTTAFGVNPGPAPSVAPPFAGGRVSAGGEDDGIRSGGPEEWCPDPRRFELFGFAAGFACGLGVGRAAGENPCGVVIGWLTLGSLPLGSLTLGGAACTTTGWPTAWVAGVWTEPVVTDDVCVTDGGGVAAGAVATCFGAAWWTTRFTACVALWLVAARCTTIRLTVRAALTAGIDADAG